MLNKEHRQLKRVAGLASNETGMMGSCANLASMRMKRKSVNAPAIRGVKVKVGAIAAVRSKVMLPD